MGNDFILYAVKLLLKNKHKKSTEIAMLFVENDHINWYNTFVKKGPPGVWCLRIRPNLIIFRKGDVVYGL